MANVIVTVIGVLATLLCLIVGYFYLRLRSVRAQQERLLKGHQEEKEEPVPPGKGKVSSGTPEDQDQISSPVCGSEDSSGDTKGPRSGRWPIDEQTSTVPSSAKNSVKKISNDKVQDAMDYCGHIQSEIKKTKHRLTMEKIEAEMSKEEKMEERLIQKRQIEEIFKLMQNHKEDFGLQSVDEIQEQVKLYINM